MGRDNYKAKWLAAMDSATKAPQDVRDQTSKALLTARGTAVNASLAVQQIQNVAIEAASWAKKVAAVMDEFNTVAGLDLGTVSHGIDGKLSEMPVPVMLRRIRDVLIMAETRIGVLSTSAQRTHEELAAVHDETKQFTIDLEPLQTAVVSAKFIGMRPTAEELDEMRHATGDEYRRHGLAYEDLSHDWFELQTQSKNNNIKPNGAAAKVESDDSDSEDDELGSSKTLQVATTDRGAIARRNVAQKRTATKQSGSGFSLS